MQANEILKLTDELSQQVAAQNEYDSKLSGLPDKVKWIALGLFVFTFVVSLVTVSVFFFIVGFLLTLFLLLGLFCYAVLLHFQIAGKRGLQHFVWSPQYQIDKMVRRIVKGRSPCNDTEYLELWNGNVQYEQTARIISRIIADNMGFPPNVMFYPDDSFPLMIFDSDDGMDQIETIMEIEKVFHIQLDDKKLSQQLSDHNFLFYHFITFIFPQIKIPVSKN